MGGRSIGIGAQRGSSWSRSRRRARVWIALVIATVIGTPAVVAYADDVYNDLDGSIDSTAEVMNLSFPGAAGSTQLQVIPTGGDGKGGCNLTGSTTLVVGVGSSNSAVATVSPSSLTFDSCGAIRTVTVTPTGVGAATISLTLTSNNSDGTFNLAPATFTVNVTAADTTPPVITPVLSGTLGTNGWYTSNVSLAWTVTDSQSAVTIDNGCTSQLFTSDTTAAVAQCQAHSLGGASSQAITIKLDQTAPTTSLQPAGTPGTNGWFVSDVSVATTGTDSVSGIASCTPAQLFTSETAGATVNGSCTNGAGLSTNAAPLTLKLDKTAPSAGLAVTGGTLGANGWYTSDVTVHASGADTISGPATCSADVIVSTETTGSQVAGSCSNAAGLSANTTPLNVKLDKSNPSASISLDGAIGADNWYTSAVLATTIGADAVSEPVTCTAPQTFSDDTTGSSANGACTNDAGLEQAAVAASFKIDQTAPTDVSLEVVSGSPGVNGWYTSGVVVRTTGSDPTSGVTCTADQPVWADGTTTLTGSCTNGAGLVTPAEPLTVNIDTTGPTAVLTVTDGVEGANGWYVSNATVSTIGDDPTSGPVTCTTDQVLIDETTGQLVNGECTNAAGLTTAAAPITIKLDKSAPEANLEVMVGTLGQNDWYVTDVTVVTNGIDDVSGPLTCTESQTFSQETTGVAVNGSCSNDAGLTSDAESLMLKMDKTGPTAELSVTEGDIGSNGWYVSNVVVSTAGIDDMSGGVSCTANQTIDEETAGFETQGLCTNAAGLTTSASPITIKLDKTGPTAGLAATGTVGANDWFTSNVDVTTTGDDAISGSVTCSPVVTLTAETTGTTVNGACTNQAGLSTDADPMTVKLDKTGPSAALSVIDGQQGTNDWYTSDVTVRADGADDISDPVSCTDDLVLTNETTGTPLTGSCTNAAGLTTDASPITIKIDKTSSTAAISLDGVLGDNGWYVSPVIASTSGAETVSEPVTCTGPQTLTDDTTGTNVGGTCTNHAGLQQVADDVVVKIDQTPPTDVSLSVTAGAEGSNGWYTTDVTVTATGSDLVSGVTCSVDQTVTAEGSTVVDGSCVNGAGLTTDAAPITIKIDRTGPTATLAVSAGTEGMNGWYTSSVTVATSGDDEVSGLVTCTAVQTFEDDSGAQIVSGSCTNGAGLTTDAEPLTIKIDTTAPSALLTPSGTAGSAGWFTSDVAVTTSGFDSTSGPVDCSPLVTLTDETADTVIHGECINQAGLATTAEPLTIKIDKTGPSSTLSVVAGDEGTNDWYTSDVTIQAVGNDDISGPVTCSDNVQLVNETASTPVTGSCTNAAGLTTHAAPLTVRIDKTSPTATIGLDGVIGGNGWYITPVTATTHGADSVSTPVTCTAPQNLTDDTAGTTVSGICTNGAGLQQAAGDVVVKIDQTAPTNVHLSVTSGLTGTNGWYVSDVVVSTSGSDTVSGVSCSADQAVAIEGATTVHGSCVNGAGLVTEAAPLTVKVDKTGPSASLAVTAGTLGANGWYVSDVTITTSGEDSASGVSSCTANQHLTAETTGQVTNGTCTNAAGLTTHAPSITIKLDKAAPSVALVGGPANGAGYYFGSVPAAPTCGANDSFSGVATCSVTGYGTNVGPHSVIATATDNAGNQRSTSNNYSVLGWTIQGFYQPVDMNGVWNSVKAGSTVPLKFELFAGPTELTATSLVAGFTVNGVTCPSSTVTADDIEFTTTGGTTLRYDSSGGQFIQNWQTPKNTAGKCYMVTMTTLDGSSIAANFKLK